MKMFSIKSQEALKGIIDLDFILGGLEVNQGNQDYNVILFDRNNESGYWVENLKAQECQLYMFLLLHSRLVLN